MSTMFQPLPVSALNGSSVTVGNDGLGLISYYAHIGYVLRVAHCADVACTGAAISTLGNATGPSSVTVGADGLGLITYNHPWTSSLKVAHLSNVLGVPWHRRR